MENKTKGALAALLALVVGPYLPSLELARP